MLVTPHFSEEEFACHDGTPYPLTAIDDEVPGGLLWRETRLVPLCETLEIIRDATGGAPLHVDSGYRTLAFDEKLYEASRGSGQVAPASRSQHPKGRAADIVSGAMRPHELFNLVQQLYLDGKLPRLGGVGLYPNFIHVDVRPRGESKHFAIWGGSRLSNVA